MDIRGSSLVIKYYLSWASKDWKDFDRGVRTKHFLGSRHKDMDEQTADTWRGLCCGFKDVGWGGRWSGVG